MADKNEPINNFVDTLKAAAAVDITVPATELEVAELIDSLRCVMTKAGSDRLSITIRRLAFQRDLLNHQKEKCFLEGYIAGITAYAWWKNGEQYVGTCGTTLSEAIAKAREEYDCSAN